MQTKSTVEDMSSRVKKNYDRPRTPKGDPYHGNWVADIPKLDDKFGKADDLKTLSKADAPHSRWCLPTVRHPKFTSHICIAEIS